MPRILFVALLASLLVIPATAEGKSSARLRGTVSAKSAAAHRVAVKSARQAYSLRVPGSLAPIRVSQRVELRGSVLRSDDRRSEILATGVSIASSQPISAQSTPKADDDEANDDADDVSAQDDDDDRGGSGSANDDDDDDSSGPGSGDDDAENDD